GLRNCGVLSLQLLSGFVLPARSQTQAWRPVADAAAVVTEERVSIHRGPPEGHHHVASHGFVPPEESGYRVTGARVLAADVRDGVSLHSWLNWSILAEGVQHYGEPFFRPDRALPKKGVWNFQALKS